MNPLEFKCIRESLALSAEDVARLSGKQSGRSVRYWESGQQAIPAEAIDALAKMDGWVESRIQRELARNRSGLFLGVAFDHVGDLKQHDPRAWEALGSLAAHRAYIWRLVQALRRAGHRAEIVTFKAIKK